VQLAGEAGPLVGDDAAALLGLAYRPDAGQLAPAPAEQGGEGRDDEVLPAAGDELERGKRHDRAEHPQRLARRAQQGHVRRRRVPHGQP